MKYRKSSVKKFTNKKLYEQLTKLKDERIPNDKAIAVLLEEIGQRDCSAYEAGKIEAEVEKSKRFAVNETTDILLLDIQYYEDYLKMPKSETDPYERKLRAAKLAMVQTELARRID